MATITIPQKVTAKKIAANCNVITTSEGKYLQSYDSIIAFTSYEGQTILDADTWDYSRMTGTHRNQFLGEGIAETREKIDNGTYILSDLN